MNEAFKIKEITMARAHALISTKGKTLSKPLLVLS
jgi:hypothetical protein